MMSMLKNGTKMSWTFSGMIRLSSLYSGPRTAAMISGGNTCEL